MSEVGKVLGTQRAEIAIGEKRYTLFPLDLSDISDGEDRLGPVTTWAERQFTLKDSVFLLWLSVRKHGLTDAQIERSEWQLTERQLARGIPLQAAGTVGDALTLILELSGIATKDPAKNPPGGDGPAPSAPSSGPASSTISSALASPSTT